MKEKAKALIAIGMDATAIVVATDSGWLASDIEAISDDAGELGIELPPLAEPGLYLWEGEISEGTTYDLEQVSLLSSGTEYEGTLRSVATEELTTLLAIRPPIVCTNCHKKTPYDEKCYKDDKTLTSSRSS